MKNTLLHFAALLDQGETPNVMVIDENVLLTNILNLTYFLAGLIAVIVIIVAGIMYTSSSGNAARVTTAKNALTYSLVGLVVVVLAFVITNFVIGRF